MGCGVSKHERNAVGPAPTTSPPKQSKPPIPTPSSHPSAGIPSESENLPQTVQKLESHLSELVKDPDPCVNLSNATRNVEEGVKQGIRGLGNSVIQSNAVKTLEEDVKDGVQGVVKAVEQVGGMRTSSLTYQSASSFTNNKFAEAQIGNLRQIASTVDTHTQQALVAIQTTQAQLVSKMEPIVSNVVQTAETVNRMKEQVLSVVKDTGMAPAVELLVQNLGVGDACNTLDRVLGDLKGGTGKTFALMKRDWVGEFVDGGKLVGLVDTLPEKLRGVSQMVQNNLQGVAPLQGPLQEILKCMDGAVSILGDIAETHPALKVGFMAIGMAYQAVRAYQNVSKEITELFQTLAKLTSKVEDLAVVLVNAETKEQNAETEELARAIESAMKLKTSCLAFCMQYLSQSNAMDIMKKVVFSQADKQKIDKFKLEIDEVTTSLEEAKTNTRKAMEHLSRLNNVADTISKDVVVAMEATLAAWSSDIKNYIKDYLEDLKKHQDEKFQEAGEHMDQIRDEIVGKLTDEFRKLRGAGGAEESVEIEVWDNNGLEFCTFLVMPPCVESLVKEVKEEGILLKETSNIRKASSELGKLVLGSKVSHRQLENYLKSRQKLSIAILNSDNEEVSATDTRRKTPAEELNYKPIASTFGKLEATSPYGNSGSPPPLPTPLGNGDIYTISVNSLDPLAKLRTWLSPVDFSLDMKQYETDYVQGTRVWAWKCVNRWLTDSAGSAATESASRMLWLKAGAGLGKSMIAWLVTQHLDESCVLGGYFFCKHNHARKNNLTNIIQTLAYQLASKFEVFRVFLRMRLAKETPGSSLLSQHPSKVFEELIVHGLKKVEESPSPPSIVLLIIDALDECYVNRPALLNLLKESATKLPKFVRIFTTGRPETDIYNALASINADELVPLSERIEQDLRTYITNRLKESLPEIFTDLSPSSKKDILDILVKVSGNTFVVPRVICDDLHQMREGITQDNVVAEISKYEEGMKSVYSQVLSKSLRVDDQARMKAYKGVMSMILSAKEPMTAGTISAITAVPEENVKEIVSLLPSFLRIDVRQRIVVIHKSVTDFLCNKSSAGPFFIDIYNFQNTLSLQLLNILTAPEVLYEGISGCTDPTIPYYEKEEFSITGPPELRYSCKFLIDHLKMIPDGIQDEVIIWKKLSLFANKTLLHWVEAMLALNQYRTLIQNCAWMSALTGSTEDEQKTVEMFTDVKRLLFRYQTPLAFNPVQIYKGVLDTAPLSSLVRKTYRTPQTKLCDVLWGLSKDWGYWLWSLESHRGKINSVVYSPSGLTIASGGADCRILLWDVDTGVNVMTLKGHKGPIVAMVFTPCGTRLVSTSVDRLICVWDLATGNCLKQWNVDASEGGGKINCLSYVASTDSLLTGSSKGFVEAWDLEEGGLDDEQKFVGFHDGEILCMDLSLDGKLLVTGGKDESILMWDLKSRCVLGRLDCDHTHGFPASVNFSPDATKVAISFYGAEASVKVYAYDATSSTFTLIWEQLFDDESLCAKFSVDGKYVIASCAKTIKVFTAGTGQLRTEMAGHTSYVLSLSIAKNGKYVASGSKDGTVKIWDLVKAQEGETDFGGSVEPVMHQIKESFMSTDGLKMAFITYNKTLEVFDSTTQKTISFSQNQPHDVTDAIFSPDNTRFATICENSVKVWDLNTYAELSHLQNFSARVCNATFSHDNSKIYISLNTADVGIWDVETAQPLAELKNPEPIPDVYYFHLSASPDPETNLLVSTSHSGCLTFWDLETSSPLKSLKAHSYEDLITQIQICPYARHEGGPLLMATAGADKKLKLWDVKSCELLAETLLDSPGVIGIRFLEGGTRVSVQYSGGEEDRWEIVTQEEKEEGEEEEEEEKAYKMVLRHIKEGQLVYKDAWIRCNDRQLMWVPPDWRAQWIGTHGATLMLKEDGGSYLLEFHTKIALGIAGIARIAGWNSGTAAVSSLRLSPIIRNH
ncbi:hypothetical protein HDV05_003997 [Chytridiales sp. JEL 0842]|nr:hypothetical protein HDV05_003997 [Chytridiales sp. JEL 0842]